MNKEEHHAEFAHNYTTQDGVRKIQGVQRVWGPKSKIALVIGLAIVCYIYSLDGMTGYLYAALATSSYSQHSKLGAIATAQAVILADFKPVAAKLADTLGRAESFTISICFYVLGYVLVATSNNFSQYAAGQIIYYAGYAMLQILIVIVISDVTNLKWRGFATQLWSLPFIINFGVAANIANAILQRTTWKWGYGMLLIIVFVGSIPIITTLYWAQNRAKKLGVLANDMSDNPEAQANKESRSWFTSIKEFIIDVDMVGLILFAAAWTCVLLPLTLTDSQDGTGKRWSDGDMIALITVGGVLLIALVLYEIYLAPRPVFPLSFFKNLSVVACALINLFDFVAFYLQYTFQYSFIYVIKDWSTRDQGYFAYTQSLSLTIFAIMAGIVLRFTRRVKLLLIIGLAIRVLGVGLMIKSKGAHGSTAELIITQILQGMGGGIAACTTMVLAQALMPHQFMASVTALVLLFAEIGNAVGTAIATAVWRNTMPQKLNERLNGLLTETETSAVFASIITAKEFQTSNPPAYTAIVDAYTDVMKTLLIAATCVAAVPFIISFFVRDIVLTDAHNVVENVDEEGATPNVHRKESRDDLEKSNRF